jgi:hypothetical protein
VPSGRIWDDRVNTPYVEEPVALLLCHLHVSRVIEMSSFSRIAAMTNGPGDRPKNVATAVIEFWLGVETARHHHSVRE